MRPDARVAAGLAVAVVGLALGAILLFGRLSYPGFPSLREAPQQRIPGTVAWLRWEGEACLHAVPASGGEPRVLHCDDMLAGPLAFTPDGLIEVVEHRGPRRGTLLTLDPASGAVADRVPLGSDWEPRRLDPGDEAPDGRRLRTESRDGVVRLVLEEPDGQERDIARAEGPRDYAWWSAQWAPGFRHALVVDSGRRLLVVRVADGATWLLARDAGDAAWGPSRE